MKSPVILLLLWAVCLSNYVTAQTCSTLGQNPGTAFPVCGSTDFAQSTVPLCGGQTIPGPCNETILKDLNPYWYKFTCYKGGTLGFEITPNNLADDYDWQLFDITGHSVQEVYTNDDLFVACNWSGYEGVTGASEEGTDLVSCSGNNPIWSAMPTLIEGHEYLLLVSHFTNSQSGYKLSFKGGTAEITDNLPAAMQVTDGYCTANSMYVKLNKEVKCSSISPDGSDFSIGGASVQVVGARSAGCSNNFTTDSIVVEFDGELAPGTYLVNVKRGNDLNTLLNTCDVEMVPASSNFRVYESVSANFAHSVTSGCNTDTVSFSHDGSHGVHTWNWTFDESASSAKNPVVTYNSSGEKTATLVVHNDFCSDTASVTISLAPKLNAAFAGPDILCVKDAASFADQSTGPIARYSWNFGDGHTSALQNPEPFHFNLNNSEAKYRVSLTVNDNAGCSDSTVKEVLVVGNCNIMVPSAFSPNRDGRNEELYPTNAFNAEDLMFRVYNRFGQVVFESRDWQKRWDGNVNGQPQPSGTYVWTLTYKLKMTGRQYSFRGTTLLVR